MGGALSRRRRPQIRVIEVERVVYRDRPTLMEKIKKFFKRLFRR
jgi:hypothetical protein